MPVLGKIGLVNRGTYSASASYTALDFVLYNGSSFVALKGVSGVTPTNDGVNWQYLALGTAVSLKNNLTTNESGAFALDAAQGPVITGLIDAKAPKSHASTATTYGVGTASNFGHVKLSDTYSSKQSSGAAANGVGASQNALYNAYANRAPVSHASTGTTYGIGNASNFGHTKLSDTYASKVTNGAAANGVGASQNALYNAYNALNSQHTVSQKSITWKSGFSHTDYSSKILAMGKIRILVLNFTSSDDAQEMKVIATVPSDSKPAININENVSGNSGAENPMIKIGTNGEISLMSYIGATSVGIRAVIPYMVA